MRESRDVPLYNVPMRTKFDLLAARRVAKIIREGGYRILHGHSVRTALIGGIAARMAGVPMVYHAHSPASHDSTRRLANRLNGLVERLSLRRRIAGHRRLAGDGGTHRPRRVRSRSHHRGA